MLPKHYTDPLGSKLPALEQNILKLRAMEMMLVLFYAEELRREVLDLIRATDGLKSRLAKDNHPPVRVPSDAKNPLDKALNALVSDRAITAAEKKEIVGLIDYRNVVAHQMHNLFVDLSPERVARQMVAFSPDRLPKYNFDAVRRLPYFLKKLRGLYRTHHYVTTLRFDGLIFKSAERAFLAKIKRLDRKIVRLLKSRQSQIKQINSELILTGSGLEDEFDPQHPLSHYDDGRLTKRGVEICYRLFDMRKSAMSVAHLTGLSLKAAKKRQKMWTASGGAQRMKVEIATIPHRKFYRRYDD
jgi:hypothetical protein